jgi:hypothetical protein
MRRRSLIAAWLALVWERAVPVIWPGLAWAACFAVLSLLGIWENIGDPWRAIYAVSTLLLAGGLTLRAARHFAWPDDDSLARRIEDDSGIRARPHEALVDRPSEADPMALRVWQEHQARMAKRLKSARARRPRAAWADLDSFALRGSLAVLLAMSWFLAGPNARDRLGEAFSLAPISAGGLEATYDAWIDPPAYTGRAPIFLSAGQNEVEVPEGSEFVARIAGSRREPRISRRDLTGSTQARLTSIGDSVWEARIDINEDSSLRLRAGPTRETWSLTILPDTVPVVRILEVPDATASGELDLKFAVSDDYGAVSYGLEFRPEIQSDGDWETLEIPAATLTPAEDEDGLRTLLETARHPLAGSRVEIRVIAEDAAGNIGASPELGITLPQRVFLDALARAVAEQRRTVMTADADYAELPERPAMLAEDITPGPAYLAEEPERRIERAPEGLQFAARALDAISDAPGYFFEDAIVYLGLRETVHRLRRARSQAELGSLDDDLWNIALRAELGSLADAEAALRAAERALMEALARGADETELAALFEAFQAAMENYLAAMAREAVENSEMAEGPGEQLNTEGLQALLDALRDAAELGDTADARQALAALSEMLRNMQMQMSQGAGEGEQEDPIAEAIARALEELGDVIGEQRDLQDQTFGLGQEEGGGAPQPGSEGGQEGNGQMPQSLSENQSSAGQAQALAEMQGALAEQLQRSRQGLPDGSEDSLGQAGNAMREAEQALQQGDAQGALEAQEEALADLRAGAEELARDLLERMQDQQGEMAEGEDNRDPLGRPADGAFADGSGVEVPGEMSRARAREILQELRRRAAEAGRSQEELDYIDRLLDRF